MANRIVPITPPRVAFIDPKTGAVSREWYRFFLSLAGIWDTIDLIISSPSQEVVASALTELQKQVDTLVVPPVTAGVDNGPHVEGVSAALVDLRKHVDGMLATPPPPFAEQIDEIRKQIDTLVVQPTAPAVMDLLAELQKQVNAIPTNGGGAIIGSATIDLGVTPVADASIVVPVVGMLATHSVQVYVMGSDSTVDNDALAHRHAGVSWQMVATPVAGSFTLDIASMTDVCWGTFKIRYSYQ